MVNTKYIDENSDVHETHMKKAEDVDRNTHIESETPKGALSPKRRRRKNQMRQLRWYRARSNWGLLRQKTLS